MKRLIWIVGIFALLYGGYWFVGRSGIQTGAETVLTDMRDDGWTVDYTDLSTRGFPSRFDTTLTDVTLFDPATLSGWTGDWLQVFALSYRPNEVIALFPPDQTLTLGGEEFRLESSDMRASAAVRAATNLPFDRATLDMQAPRLNGPDDAWQIAASRILIALRDTRVATNTYDFFAEVESLALPRDIRLMLDPDAALPQAIRLARLDGNLSLSHPVDRFAGDAPVNVTGISLREFALGWGDLEFRAVGDIVADASGFASGNVTLTLRRWQEVLDLLVRAGMVQENASFTIAAMAQNMDATPDDPDLLTLKVTMANGLMNIGGLPVGTAPQLR
ncbi:DUF2125 domain-containing protein [Octadecabacter sp. R77987]|uniref:DUF2125 domain-containing protein n=1 Tax=Octadecabacter sp. R77987 TaxID=3093874 RepID=UPI00366DC731